MVMFIANAVKDTAYPEYCKLKDFHKEIVMAAKIEDGVNSGLDVNDIAKMASETPEELMKILDICEGCGYLRFDECKGASYKQAD